MRNMAITMIGDYINRLCHCYSAYLHQGGDVRIRCSSPIIRGFNGLPRVSSTLLSFHYSTFITLITNMRQMCYTFITSGVIGKIAYNTGTHRKAI